MTFGSPNGGSYAIKRMSEMTRRLRLTQKPCVLCRSHLNRYRTVGPVDPMRKLFWWLTRDKDGLKRIEEAKTESKAIERQIAEQISEDKTKINVFRSIQKENHLAELFDREFGRGRD